MSCQIDNKFRLLIDNEVSDFVAVSESFGEPVLTTMALKVKSAFEYEYAFICSGITQLRPADNATVSNMMKPIFSLLQQIQEYRDANRSLENYFNHLATMAESAMALSWVSLLSTPVQYIRDMKEAGDYFGNRVLSANKGNPDHMNWVNKWRNVMNGLENYVKQYHLTGFGWNSANTSQPGGGTGRCAPPPPPPPPMFAESHEHANASVPCIDSNRNALLQQLNQGVGIVSRLKPVAPRQETNQAPQTRAPAVQHATQHPPQRVYEPKTIKEGRKWRVEHYKNTQNLSVQSDDMSESLAMFKCENVTFEARSKMNGVTIDNCKKATIVVHDIISSVDLIRCDRVYLKCMGHVPLISLDNCDCVQVFLTDKCIDAEVISSKSTSLNICLLAEDGDYVELPVPEQIKTVVVNKKLQNSVIEKM